MPIIDITLLEGRDDATRRRLLREVTATVQSVLAAPPESIRVVLREVPRSHYAVAGVVKDEVGSAAPGQGGDRTGASSDVDGA